MSKELNKAMELLRGLVSEIERQTCEHEETHRGGAIWEICDSCGAKWADDEGGKPEFEWPESVEKAREFLAAHPAVEQAGGDERAVDGKPRATKCPDCGEGDLMPGDLCACGYETDPSAGYACSECDGSGDGYVGEVCRECDGSGWFVTPEQARAALAQLSGEVVVTENESGAIVSVTRQDKEGRVLSVIAESATLTAQAEQAEAERPEVVAYLFVKPDGTLSMDAVRHKPSQPAVAVMTVAQHERIVGELRAENAEWQEAAGRSRSDVVAYIAERAKLLEERAAALVEVERLRESKGDPVGSLEKCMKVMYERDEHAKQLEAALARVAELEKGTMYVEARQCDECQHGGINDSATGVAACHECDWTGPEPEEDRCPGCQRENCMAAACPQCGARYVLVASEEIAAPVAQAQHSVPEGWVQSLPLKDHQPCNPNEDRANGYTIPIYSRPVLVEEALRKLRAVLCDPIGNVVIDGSDGDREEVQRALGMLAAAPGKEGNDD